MDEIEKIITDALKCGEKSIAACQNCLSRHDRLMLKKSWWPCTNRRIKKLQKRALAKAKYWYQKENSVLRYIQSGLGLEGKEYHE